MARMQRHNFAGLLSVTTALGLIGIIVGLVVVMLVIPGKTGDLTIAFPFEGSLFPPEIAPMTVRWDDAASGADAWKIIVRFPDGGGTIRARSTTTSWTPTRPVWETIKQRSLGSTATVTVRGYRSSIIGALGSRFKPVSAKSVTIATSPDSVNAPIFYRDVPLPFDFAREKMELIQWRLGDISKSERPPVVLENMPVCGNCHSFTPDGSTLAMDVDSGGDKGSYAILPIEERMFINRENLITWTDYRREDGETTFGLLAEISPDGRYVASAVKDRVIFITREKLMFSQLFFPVKGIVAIYDRTTKTIKPLPGADDPNYVQANPTWSPDGKYIIFARCRITDFIRKDRTKNAVLTRRQSAEVLGGERYLEDSEGGEVFTFDLFRIPFNDGKGGTPEPVPGASNNGKSNYFARYSPDGKWIIFCQARSFMLLQPDSKLFIMPADFSAPPKMLANNTDLMNSRHSWSPNSKWLVFSSKAFGPYTDLFLTHIDENGNDSPPVLLSSFSATDRARNIPEFANIPQDGIKQISEAFVDYYSYARKGDTMVSYNKFEEALASYQKSIELNPNYAPVRRNLGSLLMMMGKNEEAGIEFDAVLKIDPKDTGSLTNRGFIFLDRGDLALAEKDFNAALRIDPRFGAACQGLGMLRLRQGNSTEARRLLNQAIAMNADLPDAYFTLGAMAMDERNWEAARRNLELVLRYRETSDLYARLGAVHIELKQFDKAEEYLGYALRMDPNNYGAMHSQGIIYLNRGDVAKAEAVFRAVYDAAPNNPSAIFMLATVLAKKQGGMNAAIELFNKGLSIAPNPQAFIDLGNLYANAGRNDLAIQMLENALKMDPSIPGLKETLSKMKR